MTGPIRIAMWSGPRNLSTTMMRSFGARADTACVDEPFYAAFLRLSDEVHPLQDEIFAAHEADPAKVIASLTENEVPDGKPVFYQKHMNHHMVDGIPMDWLGRIDHHVMLVRHPARVIASYQRKMETLSLEAIGAPQQFAKRFVRVSPQSHLCLFQIGTSSRAARAGLSSTRPREWPAVRGKNPKP